MVVSCQEIVSRRNRWLTSSDFGTIDNVAKLLYPRIRLGTFDGAEGRCNNRQVHSGSLLLLFGHVWFSFEQHWTVTLLIYLIKRYIEVMVIPGWIEIGDYEELPHLEVEAFRFWDMCLSFPIQPVNLYCLLSMGFNISCDPRWQVLTCNKQSQRPMRISGRMSCTINMLWIAARRPAEILDPVLLCGWHWGNKPAVLFTHWQSTYLILLHVM